MLIAMRWAPDNKGSNGLMALMTALDKSSLVSPIAQFIRTNSWIWRQAIKAGAMRRRVRTFRNGERFDRR